MARGIPPCGTYAAYVRHLRFSEPTDAGCRRAATAYMRQYRAANPDVRDRERAAVRTRNRALELLAREYPARFLEILDAVRAIDKEEARK